MKIFLSLTALAALALAGCNHSPEGGTSGTSRSFTISAPTMTTTIKQDNKESIKLTMNRGSDFKKTITLTAVAPEKLKAELSKTTLTSSDPSDVVLNVSVAKDAPLGDATIRVTGTPEGGGASTSVEVKIKVEKN